MNPVTRGSLVYVDAHWAVVDVARLRQDWLAPAAAASPPPQAGSGDKP